jgi:hypothetical protein
VRMQTSRRGVHPVSNKQGKCQNPGRSLRAVAAGRVDRRIMRWSVTGMSLSGCDLSCPTG